jgi:hypothetical protein
LDPSLGLLCVKFKKPIKTELGAPVWRGIHLFTDIDTEEITVVEIFDLED